VVPGPALADPHDLFDGCPLGLDVLRRVRSMLEEIGEVEIRATKSQVAFRRRRGFAYLWRPSRWLRTPGTDVVLSIALARGVGSPRFKEVVQPTPRLWMHHLEVHSLADLDDEVGRWLAEAWAAAA
jgi:hypothetical protein